MKENATDQIMATLDEFTELEFRDRQAVTTVLLEHFIVVPQPFETEKIVIEEYVLDSEAVQDAVNKKLADGYTLLSLTPSQQGRRPFKWTAAYKFAF